MPDVLALWDGFIADTGRPLPLLYYVCVAIIIWVSATEVAYGGSSQLFAHWMSLVEHPRIRPGCC